MTRSRRYHFHFDPNQIPNLKQKLTFWVGSQNPSLFLDSNDREDHYGRYNWLAAIGARSFVRPSSNHFEELQEFRSNNADWLFGHLSYELKNHLEELNSVNPSTTSWPDLYFFVPETVIYKKRGDEQIFVESFIYEDTSSLLEVLSEVDQRDAPKSKTELQLLTDKEEYLQRVANIKEHLQYGNIYELNYCIEYGGNTKNFSPEHTFNNLNEAGQAPFSAFYRLNDSYALCASPERFMQKNGQQIIAQPIKGTSARSKDPEQDAKNKKELFESQKERSENVMIVDLLRNDLSKTARAGSVKVDELFGIYSFEKVHQMISTISCEVDEKYELEDVLKNAFPMGSMTGAPKNMAMKIIDEQESFSRDLYSGSVGYIDPNGDFDFNVMIRSLFYESGKGYLSARIGSAITIYCEAEKEFEECMLKSQGLLDAIL